MEAQEARAHGPARSRRPGRWPRWLRRSLWALGILALVGLVAVLAISWKAGQDLLHPERVTDPRTPSALNLTWSWANFTTADGVSLGGWWVPAQEDWTMRPSIVFVHGYGDAKAQALEVIPFLHNASYNVLAFDQRAHGQSGGDYTTAGLLETQDVAAALGWLKRQPGLPGDPDVAVIGWSAGGAAVLRGIADHPTVDAIVIDSAFSRLQRIVESSIGEFTDLPRWPFGPLSVRMAGWSVGQDLKDNAPVESIRGVRIPILLVQGGADFIVTPDQVQELAAAAPPEAAAVVVTIPRALHLEGHKVGQAQYEGAVLGFLAGVFGPR